MVNRIKFLSFLLLLTSFSSESQSADSKSILEPIYNLFSAMEKGDSALAHSSFYEDATLATVVEREGKISLRKETLQPFLNAIANPHPYEWHEPIWDVKIDQDGGYAQVWAQYAFFLGKKFNHCGVDSFQLIKTETGWKIFYLTDTRKKEGCSVPDEITKKYSEK